MTAALWVSVLGILLAAALTIGGWAISHLLSRLRTQEDLINAQRDLISDIRAQRDMLKVSTEIQDRFFSVVPKLPPSDKGTS